MILKDLQKKTLDTTDHNILLERMNSLSFSESAITWFTSYLNNRSLVVNVGSEYSFLDQLSCSVPQGSIFGPLLFLLYVNDITQAVNSELLLYTDNTCLIYRDRDA